MLIKDIAKQTIDDLPNDANYNDIMYALYVKSNFDQGLDDIKNSNGIRHEEAIKRLEKWLK